MTDFLGEVVSVPTRLGVSAEYRDGEFVMQLRPRAEVLHHGVVRASVLSFMVDVVAGIVLDDDPNAWSLTSDMSVRMRPAPAPECVRTKATILRRGRRSATAVVDLVTNEGQLVASGAVSFVKVARRDTDPPKPMVTPERTGTIFDGTAVLSGPLRQEAGIAVIDPMQGVVEMPLTAGLRNSAGTLQGAMVALLAEAAAEDLIAARFDIPAVVIDLDLRYLAQTAQGPVRTRCRLLGDGPDAAIEIELVDLSSERLTTLVYARATAAPG